ncbi:spermatogenesis-associated protein 20-like [Antedon mediterranea]|uniref:spermatogenesis-associated protein 20-like n=1 Tax=Antedon mediterranea TaxID=105859 RepID=UPI003AFA0006
MFKCISRLRPALLPTFYAPNRRHLQLGLVRNMATTTTSTTTGTASGSQPKFKNSLSKEKSPYLLQHAANPVNWYPWGEEAFQKAKEEDKIIFLSVGYSTCHWCHVMERESFENKEIGDLLNKHFVSIKVDREERPDVDRVYMTFIQATSGGGGWPMSVWLTPDLKPLIGGTYFAPTDRFGRPGFATILQRIASQWTDKKDDMKQRSMAIMEALVKNTAVKQTESKVVIDQEAIKTCYRQMSRGYDSQYGGFGDAPKFPQPVNFNFMFRYHDLKLTTKRSQAINQSLSEGAAASSADDGDENQALAMCLHTLKTMAKGGMNDHLGLGFHRYSTDRYWHVPHFEKMLYDQAQLAVSYLDAYQLSKDESLADVARDILNYVDRDLHDQAGGFYSAEDADSFPSHDSKDKKEGAFCVWEESELNSLLSSDTLASKPSITLADIFNHHYGVNKDGNVDFDQDPHGELKGQNVLIIRGNLAKTADHLGIDKESAATSLYKAKDILFQARLQRPRPHLDDKMITAWNGLMLSAYARAGQVLRDDRFTQIAVRAAEFIKQELYDQNTNTLFRTAYKADAKATERPTLISGFTDDYAFLIRGLLDLYEACFDEELIKWAEQLQQTQDKLFWDDNNGGAGYFSVAANDPNILLRLKEDQDGAEPSPNSVSALNLIRLSDYLDHEPYREMARALLNTFHERLQKIPIALPEMMCAVMNLEKPSTQIFICGSNDSSDTKKLLDVVHAHFIPNKILVVTDGKNNEYLNTKLKILSTLEKKEGKATAYVCENYTCNLPVNSPVDLDKLLAQSMG